MAMAMPFACRSIFHVVREKRTPVFLAQRSSRWFIILVISYAVFLDAFIYGLAIPIIPTALEDKLKFPKEHDQIWTSTLVALHGAAQLVVSPISGYQSDRIESRKLPCFLGIIAMISSATLLCVGNRIGLWIAGRLLSGTSAGIISTVGNALVVDTMGRDGLGQAFGYLNTALNFGIVTGPLLGGIIYHSLGYNAVFILVFSLIGVDIILWLSMIERKRAVKYSRTGRSCEGDQELTRPCDDDGSDVRMEMTQNINRDHAEVKPKWPSTEKRQQLLAFLKSHRLSVAFWGYFVVIFVLTAFDSVLPLFVQETFGWNQTGQGLVFLSISIPNIFDPLVGAVIDRFPNSCRYFAAGGMFCAALLVALLRLIVEKTIGQMVLLCTILALLGSCLGAATTAIMVEITSVADDILRKPPGVSGQNDTVALGLIYGLMSSASAAGSLAGPFFAGYIRERAGWITMTWTIALVVGISGVPLLLSVNGSIGEIFSRSNRQPILYD